MASVARRTVTGFAIGAGCALLLWLDTLTDAGYVLWSAIPVLALVSVWELARMGELAGRRLELSFGLAAISAFGLLFWFDRLGVGDEPTRRLGLLYLAAALVCALVQGITGPRARLAYHAGLAAWVIAPFAGLIPFTLESGHRALVALIVLSKVGDVFGYYVGRKLGRTHPFPNLSKGKTTAGCVASLVAGTVFGGGLSLAGLLPEGSLGILGGFLAGFVLNVCAQGGDLLESWVKRRAGVKDSGRLMGASGGLLDVVDSLLLTVPAAVVLWSWIFR